MSTLTILAIIVILSLGFGFILWGIYLLRKREYECGALIGIFGILMTVGILLMSTV